MCKQGLTSFVRVLCLVSCSFTIKAFTTWVILPRQDAQPFKRVGHVHMPLLTLLSMQPASTDTGSEQMGSRCLVCVHRCCLCGRQQGTHP